jgi:ABC-type branched-subunit amino acid transport system substrate-binding protein
VALTVVTVASLVAFVPQYGNHSIVVSSKNGTNDQLGPDATAVPGTNQGTQSTGPHRDSGRGGSGLGQGTTAGQGSSSADCQSGRNAGATDVGVTGTEIHIATTDVTTGIGRSFLGQAVDGIKAALEESNHVGGVCGRRVALDSVNDNWDRGPGAQDISGYINSGDVFALVGEPDSEGLDAATASGMIDRAGIPVVGTDGMLKSQYSDPWIWPVAASTVTNMHVAAQYAVKTLDAQHVAIVYDSVYKFGKEGAAAFVSELQRLKGGGTLGIDSSKQCAGGYCGIDPSTDDYSTPIHDLNAYCGGKGCDLVVMLLEPKPMGDWMKGEESCSCTWYTTLMGGEPLFDDNFASNTCGQDCAGMIVWSGYKPDIQPFDGETPVATYANALKAVCPSCDPHNEFTEGAYLGTKLFLTACQKVGANLTRGALRTELDSDVFDLGLSLPLRYGTGLPHQANVSMVAYRDNATGTFNGWSYMNTGYVPDPAPGTDLSGQ